MSQIPRTSSSPNGTSLTTRPFFSAWRALLRGSDRIWRVHQCSKVEIGKTAKLSHSIEYLNLIEVSGNLCRNVKRSIRVPHSRKPLSNVSGSSGELYLS